MLNEKLAHEFITAIKTIAEKEDNLSNFESYLSHHFDKWLTRIKSPEDLVIEVKSFAEIEI